MKGIQMSLAQAQAHQKKHGFLGSVGTDLTLARGPTLPKSRMNKTESEYALILEAMKRRGEINRYEFEGITLKWGGLRYTPDFVVFGGGTVSWSHVRPKVRFVEVKGAHIWDDALVKFKAARAHWPEFEFQLHQKTKTGWKQLL